VPTIDRVTLRVPRLDATLELFTESFELLIRDSDGNNVEAVCQRR